MDDFSDLPFPDEVARAAATGPHSRSLGRLAELGAWLAACQGQAPPRPVARARVVVFAADHGIAARGVSARSPEATARLVEAALDGTGPTATLAAGAGATVRVVDVGVDSDGDGEFKVRRGSGSIDTEDALTADEASAAVRAGMAVADAEVDSGADLLVPAEFGVGSTTPASVLVAALTGAEPVAVVGRGSGIDDRAWMRKAAAVRDGLRRARGSVNDPLGLLATVGGADLAALAGFLAQAAKRRTPVLLDGLVVGAAALVAEELAPGARGWWKAAHRGAEPAHALLLEHLDLEPVLELGIQAGEGTGALTALPLLLQAARLAAETAAVAPVFDDVT
ncbi:nicotinate-nucleotide--dimethylbenzimidazole phosphoribosyltransferase [Amycolatopsis suaedae]|uniref:Nicotinate-nucleotide--dimethylbenzimidazole phosphoribosyltransferase n=1 Tax=Amycolatopsis suaedae TaxID=2510978 RepID=A0A4Q7IWW6_9PSEU|nr:nicotinate-nucleotide--dimethylbenzimidazole phosphoribosyltransferase [Amycolatopsis suaedae]RZQ59420.1 nicotinate-nucleotide--dimethylbenzimidazole phosphoribosyltransferase [Amycolatopsis suaedae]